MKLNPRTKIKGMLSSLRIAMACVLICAAAAMAVYAANPIASDQPKAKKNNGIYIVQMSDSPALIYTGNVAGYRATTPKQGQKIDPFAADVVKYGDYLKGRHNGALSQVGGGQKLYDYIMSYNGFAAKLTSKQADALRKLPDVVAVHADEIVYGDTSTSPTFLGLTAPNGLWAQLGGPVGDKKTTGAGEGMIIGVIDSGIWPESKSFSDRDAKGNLVYQQIPGFHGKCEGAGSGPGTASDNSWNAGLCNQKLIAAQHFNAGFGGDAGLKHDRPWEFLSPRDFNGHGTHTSSTAGGNNGVVAGPGVTISGMAPRARLAMYKALWHTADGRADGTTSDLMAAIDQAVADGVDVINYSISISPAFFGAVQNSFLNATQGNVFVSASAGNDGPAAGTVSHSAPWITTVAAGTHKATVNGVVTLGNGSTYKGAAANGTSAPSSLLVNSTASGLTGAEANAVRLCFSKTWDPAHPEGFLDPAKVGGKIVVCERGTNDRVDKSKAVKEAGGVGMILVNVDPAVDSIVADAHSVPTVHLRVADRAAVETYAATPGATASLSTESLSAPQTADFSSRGPLGVGSGDFLKPDVMAPGVDVLAAVAPPGNGGQNFALYSGTSMAAPHVAGVAALLKQLHPSWTPMMIKSALMTTGYNVLDGGVSEAERIFRQGGGFIRPNNAANPGLVYNSGFNDWVAFLCGATTGVVSNSFCNALVGAGFSLDPSNFNVASIAIGDLAGEQTVTRRVTNVGNANATYNSSVTGLSGITVQVTPSSLTLAPGQTKSFTVKFTRTTAPVNTYAGGQLTWTDGTHTVRSPIVIRPVALSAPAAVSGTGNPINYNVRFGYTGSFTAAPRGLVAATKTPLTVADDPNDDFQFAGPGTVSYDVVVPPNTTYARFATFDAFTDGQDDIDLVVVRLSAPTVVVGSSGGSTATEEVNLVNPPADTYRVWVHGFQTDGPDAHFTLFSWVLGSTPAGNMTVSAPASATTGATGPIQLSFSGLNPATKYLGSVAYSGSPGMPNPTIVRVDTP